jgi:oxygen tolerance protein BatD
VIRPLLLLAVLAASPIGAADDVHVSASVLPQGRISETTQIRLVIRVDGSSIPDVASPKLPAMKNLRVSGGPSSARNSSYSFENGRIASSSALTLTYFLVPSGTGPAEIPPFDVVVGGTAYRTSPLRFNVEAGRAGPAPPTPGQGAPGAGGDDDTAEDASVDVFLQTKLGAPSVFSGQPVRLDVTLYAAAPVSGFTWTDVPSLQGLWAEDLPVDPGAGRRVVTMNGRPYNAYPVAQKLLVPTRSGALTIQPFTAQIQLRRSSRDPFASFFSLAGVVNVVRRTGSVKLDVKPLPEVGRPADFSGAVGSFRMKSVVDRSSLDLGDAAAVRVTIEGEGSLQSAVAPTLAAPQEVKVYEPKTLEDTMTGADHLGARKTWEWVVVPLVPGTVKVPGPAFAYFDPASGGYKQLIAEIPELTVRRGNGTGEAVASRGEVQANTKDIAFLKMRRGPLAEARPPFHKRGAFVALLALPVLLAPAGIAYGRRRERFLRDHGFARARRAARKAAKRLDRAAHRAAGSPTSFHEEIAGALVDYVADRANRPAAGLTYDQLDDILAAKGVPPEPRRRYRSCLETCDFARFVPDSGKPQAAADLVAEARAIVRALEDVE